MPYAAYDDGVLTEYQVGLPFELNGKQYPGNWWDEAAPGDYDELGLQEIVEPDDPEDGQRVASTELQDIDDVFTRVATYEDIPFDELRDATYELIAARYEAWRAASPSCDLGGGNVVYVDASQAGLGELNFLTDENAKTQLGEAAWENTSVDVTASITDNLLVITGDDVGDPIYAQVFLGMKVTGVGVSERVITFAEDGLGGVGNYLLGGDPQTVSSQVMTISGWHHGIFYPGSGVALPVMGANRRFFGFNANNQLGLRRAVYAWIKAGGVVALAKQNAVTAANASTGDSPSDARAALLAVRAGIDTGWPDPEITI